MSHTITIKTTEIIETRENGESGTQYTIACPICKEQIICAEYGWWNTKCSCGYKWRVTVLATGEKYDD